MENKRISIKADIDLDFGFWAILPAININQHSKSLEIEWLCLGIYIQKEAYVPFLPKIKQGGSNG